MTETSALRTDTMQETNGHPRQFTSVYVASKLGHAQRIYDKFLEYPRLRLTSTWVLRQLVRDKLPTESNRPAPHWLRDNKDDIVRSQSMVIWANSTDELKGAIYEAGYANAHQVPIYLIGDNRSYSRWQLDLGIFRIGSIDECLKGLTQRTMYEKKE